jgi:hypothetical protein
MECTRHSEELVRQSYDVHVCVSGPGVQITAYHRLHFALQASSWFPRPLGIALWSALHVLLLVGGALLLPLLALMLDGFLHPSLEDIIIRLIWYLSCELVLRSLIFGSILRFVSHSNMVSEPRVSLDSLLLLALNLVFLTECVALTTEFFFFCCREKRAHYSL